MWNTEEETRWGCNAANHSIIDLTLSIGDYGAYGPPAFSLDWSSSGVAGEGGWASAGGRRTAPEAARKVERFYKRVGLMDYGETVVTEG